MRNLTYRRITEEDLQDAPKGGWKGKLLYAINLFFQQLYYGLQNQLTPEENCIEQTKVFQITGNSVPTSNTFSFTTNFAYQPNFIEQWIIVADASTQVFTTSPYASCQYGNGLLNVLGISGLTDGVKYQVTIRLWWPAVTNL